LVDHLRIVLHIRDQHECTFSLHQEQMCHLMLDPLALDTHHHSIAPMPINNLIKLGTRNSNIYIKKRNSNIYIKKTQRE